jgi:type II secretion system protein N
MHRTGKWFLYALFVLVVTGLFLYMRFPEGIVRQYLIRQAGEYLSPYDLKIGTVSPAFPPGLILREVSLQRGRQQHNIFERLKITPAYTALFSPGRNLIFTAGAYNGSITCKVNLSRDIKAPQVRAQATLVKIDLEKVAWLRDIIQRNISGQLSGKVFWDTSKRADPLKARLQITAGRIDLRVPVFSLKSVTFNLVETDLAFNRQRALIQRCTFRGEQLAGNLSGSINLRTPFGESLLSLAGIFKLQPDFAQHLQKHLPEGFLTREKAASGYPIRFSGTLDKPGFSLK